MVPGILTRWREAGRIGLMAALAMARLVGGGIGAQPPVEGLAFERRAEPREGAFTLLVPRGWALEGGILRVNAAAAGGPLNAMEAKCDLTLKRDPAGTVLLRILPDIVYAHPGIGAGYWPVGSTYQGAEVRPLPDAQGFLHGILQELHPQAQAMTVVTTRSLPGEVAVLDRAAAMTNSLLAQMGLGGQTFRHDAAVLVADYREDGIQFREVLATAVVDMRAALTWKNTRTLQFRAPAADFDRWRPVMDIVRASVRFRPEWVLSEAGGQRERADVVNRVFQRIRELDREMRRTSEVARNEIMNDNYLVLTGQEEYVNPLTGEVEVDTDAFRFRWTTDNGDRFYTNKEDLDPNLVLQRSGYRRTPVRPR